MRKKSTGTANKKPPMRTCCGCRESFPKKELIRIVRQPDGTAAVDATGKLNGRGTYICRNTSCLERAKRSGSIARSLEIQILPEVYDSLKEELKKYEAG